MRAKFKVISVSEPEVGGEKGPQIVILNAVTGETNKSWAAATPNGRLTITISNPALRDHLKMDEHYFLDFSPAPEKESDEKA